MPMTTSADVPQRTPARSAPRPGSSRPGAPAPRGFDAEPEEGNASPEEQAQYQEFVENGLRLIYPGERYRTVLALLSKGDPVDALALATATIVKRLCDSAEQAGRPIPGEVKMQGGAEILADLAELSGNAGIHDFTEEEIEAAGFKALDLYRAGEGGRADPQAAQQDLMALAQADKSGQLDRAIGAGTGGAGKGA